MHATFISSARPPFHLVMVAALALIVPTAAHSANDPKPAARMAETKGFEVVHEGFDAFSRGQFENAGENLYVSRHGRMQFIHRWDLNNDGCFDLVFANTHNPMGGMVDALGYLQTNGGFRSAIAPMYRARALYDQWLQEEKSRSSVVRFAADRPGGVLFHDVDGDGYPELLFASMGANDTNHSRSVIYWGGPEGFRKDPRLELDTDGARDVAVGDLNLDGYEDIVFANHGNTGSFIYWGSGNRHGAANRTSVATAAAMGCAIGDLDGDGYPELIFADEGGLIVYRGSTSGPDLKAPVKIGLRGIQSVRIASTPDLGVVAAAVSKNGLMCYGLGSAGLVLKKQTNFGGNRAVVVDLDHDGLADAVVAAEGDRSAILWGKSAWSAEKATFLPTLTAKDVAVADLDRDGQLDIVFANYSEGIHGNFDIPSYIYWGKAWGYGVEARTDLQTFGAAAVAAGDINHDGRLDVVFGNNASGISGGKDEAVIVYWGRAHRGYSPAATTAYPAVMPMSTAVADMDDDGNADLFVANSGRHYMKKSGSSSLYWGTPAGPAPDKVQEFPANEVGSWSVADLNRDGYLDAVACDFDALLFAWGGPDGFGRTSTRIEKVATLAASCRIVDYNRDGWLDLVVADIKGERSRVLLGGPQGYSADRCLWLDDGDVSNTEFADLNGDGFMDMVLVRSYLNSNGVIDRNNSWMRIRFGGPNGFYERPPLEFAACGAFDLAIADLNGDGHLDIALSQYQSQERRNLPDYIFWNDGHGGFSARNRMILPAEGGAGLLAADFDEDGHIDLLVVNHKTSYKEDNHTTDSYLYWGSAQGFSINDRTYLPNQGPHYMQNVDIGNLMTRKFQESYVSNPIEIPGSVHNLSLAYQGETPRGSALQFETRTAPTRDELSHAEWRKLADAGGFSLNPGERQLQYRVTFVAGHGYASPCLTGVTIRESR